MGALIQTKGTQFLAGFFTARFSGANLVTLQANTDLIDSFGTGSSLFDITKAFQNLWTDGSDILFPTTTLSTVLAAASGATQLTFSKSLPASVVVGLPIEEDLAGSPRVIPKGTTVKSIDSATQLTLTQATVAALPAATPIVFSDKDHPNLWKRWRHYLKQDMVPANHSAIQSAIYITLLDASYKGMTFQAIESSTQHVLHTTEFPVKAGKLDPANKYRQVVLLTARTTAPDKIDRQ